MAFVIRPVADADRPRLGEFMRERWGSEVVVTRGRVCRPAENPAFIAEADGEWVGVITLEFRGGECELTSLDSLREGRGIGTALLRQAVAEARSRGSRRLWLITTNDNLHALGFYQKRGLRLAALYPGAVDESRRLKPQIPLVGEYGIPLHDEIELEMRPVE